MGENTSKTGALRAAAIIPARYASTRFPAKPLAKETGKYLIQHVWERARLARSIERVIVATDDDRIAAAGAEFGAEVVMTSPDCMSGTERCAEVARSLTCDVVVNVQGDEPEMDPGNIDVLVGLMGRAGSRGETPRVATLAVRDDTKTDAGRARFLSPHVVKVVRDRGKRALYFSRAPIPYDRAREGIPLEFLRHLGMYAYDRAFVTGLFNTMTTGRFLSDSVKGGRLDGIESLEQLRWLESGESILVADAVAECEGIDTPEQYAAFVKRSREKGR